MMCQAEFNRVCWALRGSCLFCFSRRGHLTSKGQVQFALVSCTSFLRECGQRTESNRTKQKYNVPILMQAMVRMTSRTMTISMGKSLLSRSSSRTPAAFSHAPKPPKSRCLSLASSYRSSHCAHLPRCRSNLTNFLL